MQAPHRCGGQRIHSRQGPEPYALAPAVPRAMRWSAPQGHLPRREPNHGTACRPHPTHIADQPESVDTLSRRRLIPVDGLWLIRVEHSLWRGGFEKGGTRFFARAQPQGFPTVRPCDQSSVRVCFLLQRCCLLPAATAATAASQTLPLWPRLAVRCCRARLNFCRQSQRPLCCSSSTAQPISSCCLLAAPRFATLLSITSSTRRSAARTKPLLHPRR